MPPTTRVEFEVAIICALPLEASAVVDLFDEHYDDEHDIYGKQEGDPNAYSTGRIGQHDIVLAHMPGMGKSSAASVASGLRSSFTGIKLALIVGICGAVPIPSPNNPIILGDVIISNSVIEFDFGRQYPDHFERKSGTKDTLGRPNSDIRALLNKLEVRHVREKLREKILQNLANLREKIDTARYPGVNQDRLFAATHRHMHRGEFFSRDCLCSMARSHSDPVCKKASESSCDVLECNLLAVLENPARRKRLDAEAPTPLVHIGTIGSASTVMKSAEHRDLIAQGDNIIAFEMEGAGVWDNLPCIIIKGVCDYADSHKNKHWQDYAAATAASAAKAFLDYWTSTQGPRNLVTTPSRKRSYSPSIADAANVSKQVRHGSPTQRQDHVPVPIRTDQASTSLQPVPGPSGLGTRQTRLDALNFEQLDARHATIKKTHTGTCKWLFSKSEYLDWQDEQKLHEHHGFLWIKGKPGAGKSAIMKFAYSEAQARSDNSAVVSYFFNARGERLEKSTCGMYRSPLFQLLSKVPRLQVVLDGSNLGNDAISNTETLQSLFCLAIEKLDNRPLICFVDALDECEDSEDQVREMVNFFEDLGEHTVGKRIRFLVCFSSRHYPHITINKSVELILEVQQGHTEDITKYIQSNLKAGKSERVDKLKTEVQEKSQGVFLWVVLVVPMLQKAWDRGKVKSLRECLQSIPDDLNKLFKDILCRDTEDMQELVLCLKWVLYAGRPLRPEELYFGILSGTNPESLTPWEPGDDPPELINRFILSSSKGLAEPTRNKVPTIQFIHESVRDFLLKENGLALVQDNIDCTSAGSAHDQLKHCCQNYIDSVAIGKSKDSSREATTRFPFLEYSIRHIFKHAELAASHMISQEVFLADFALGAWIILHDIVEKHKIRRYGPQTSLLYVLVEQSTLHLCRTEICINQKSINTESVVRYAFPVIAAAAVGNQQILELLLQNGADINSKCKEYGNALHVAIEKGNTSVVNTLVEFGLTAQFRSKSRWADLLAQAVRKSRIQIVRLLLNSHPQWLMSLLVESRSSNDPLQEAFNSDDAEVVETFLGLFHDVRYRKDALRIASGLGKHSIVLALLDLGANDDACSYALPSAAGSGHKEIVRLLLDRIANADASREYVATAIVAASNHGYETIVRMLLDAGADINASSGILMCTALYAASENGHEVIVRLLLDHGADVNPPSGYSKTALYAASENGHEAIVRLLLDHGADVDNLLSPPHKPLHAALRWGCVEVVSLLLEYGADVDASSANYSNALMAAEAGSDEQKRAVCKQLLLDEKRKRQPEPYLVWVDGIAYFNCQ
ncbi:purine and uridine phosphorylase [Aureobasidium pullulans]|nr:purine and uridine phosphorylase [Aureobasidium pullulans]